MSGNWFFEALLRIVMPACLFDANSFCHLETRIGQRWHTNPCATATHWAQHVFLSLLSVSPAISAHHCLVLSHYPAALSGGTSAAAAALNFETDRPSAGCQMVSGKWPAYSSSLWTCCWRLPWQRQCKSQTGRRMEGDRQRAGGNRFTLLLRRFKLDTFLVKIINEINIQ